MSNKNDILLINLQQEFSEAVYAYLRHSGYNVYKAMDLGEALNALTSFPVGLIISNNELEDINGYDFLRFLKNDPLRWSIPILFFVPADKKEQSSKALEQGATDFLVFPYQMETLVCRVWELLPLNSSPEPNTGPEDFLEEATSQEIADEDLPKTQKSLPDLRTEISRDGLLWIPGQIKNFTKNSMYVETALLGKQGSNLNFRFLIPRGMYIIKGFIRHIAFNDIEKPIGIGVNIEKSAEWAEIYKHMNSLSGDASPETEQKETKQIVTPEKKSVPRSPADSLAESIHKHEVKVFDGSAPLDVSKHTKEMSYNNRFYHSLKGKQLDNYKVVSFVGSGSMGGVFKGWDIALEREVALKVISFELSSQDQYRDKFLNEARVISKLDNPNIARIYSIGYSNGILYFAMEFIPGSTLAFLIKKNRFLGVAKGLDYLITTCQTLNFVNKKNIIHRDIKPDNLIVNNKGILKVVDFGVAKSADLDLEGQQKKRVVGTPFYISPEAIGGNAVDHRSDIYSLGASFYHAFTGHLPFTGNDISDVIHKHLHQRVTPLIEKNPDVPAPLADIIEKMMEKDPANRYQDYESLNEDLEAFRSNL